MTNLITVITAVHPPAAKFLADAYKSLTEQQLPDGWDWQWVIQEDGETDGVTPHLPDDPRISFGQGRQGRAAIARTLGLSRAEGEYVKVLDADDMLTPGALARDLQALASDSSLGWATSRVLDLLPDGSTVGFDQDPPEARSNAAPSSNTGRPTTTAPRSTRRPSSCAATCSWRWAAGWPCRRARTRAC